MSSITYVKSFCVVLCAALILPWTNCRVNEKVAGIETIVLFSCEDGKVNTGASSSVLNYQWILPSGKVVNAEKQETNSSKHILIRDGFILQIQDIDQTDYGLYVCLIFLNSTDERQSIHNVRHELHRNTWHYEEATDYTLKIQYGFLAGFVVLIITVMICYNYDQHQNRFDVDKKQNGASHEMILYSSNGQEPPLVIVTPPETKSRDNQGFQKDESTSDIKL